MLKRKNTRRNLTLWLGLLTAFAGSAGLRRAGAQEYGPRIVRSTQDGSLGLGLILGEPTGITGKYWLQGPSAIDAGLAYSYSDFFLLYVDYLYHFPGAFGDSSQFVSELTPYVGGGGILFIQTGTDVNRAYFNSNQGSAGFAIRIPLGIEWTPEHAPFGVFVEVAPGVGLVPATFGLFQAGIGARFYFPTG